jgi:Flp pilus assembly protein TadD
MARRRRILPPAALLAVVGLAIAIASWRRAPEVSIRPAETSSAYRNTQPGVKFVGDAVCIRCHAEIGETYRRHPMGRSLSPIASAPAVGVGRAGDRVVFEAQGLKYVIETRQGRVFHRETRRDASGRPIAQNEAEVRFAVGSGSQGVAYLIERDGFLFQSPVTWYARERRWDLSPGYEKSNLHFDRPIQPDCLFCHADRVEAVPGSINRYRPPIFHGHAIGCERCHGPGELHAGRPPVVDGPDRTIVNPAALEPSLRDAVCEQCHLIGQRRIARLDRRSEDYRPGLPFSRFWTVLQSSSGPVENRVVGQVEQMHESRCFRASGGKLGCISCHDPHQLPAPGEKAAYYRGRCLECHADRNCRLPEAVRLRRSREDDCAGCHLPRRRSSDILHVATTDHRIRRRPDDGDPGPIPAEDDGDRRLPLVNFHRESMDAGDRTAAEREIGVALCRDGPEGAATALPLLEAALRARSDDLTARESMAFALGQLGRGEEAMAAFRTVLAKEPDRESTLTGAAFLASRGGLREEAITYWRGAIAISPWRSEYRAGLAPLLFQDRDWREAASACREALRLNPANLEMRKLLVRCYLRLGQPEAARGEFQILLGFDPPDRDELIRRFAPLTRGP